MDDKLEYYKSHSSVPEQVIDNLLPEEMRLIADCRTKCAKCNHLTIFHNVNSYTCDVCGCGDGYEVIDMPSGKLVHDGI
jgi:hypothetical protein